MKLLLISLFLTICIAHSTVPFLAGFEMAFSIGLLTGVCLDNLVTDVCLDNLVLEDTLLFISCIPIICSNAIPVPNMEIVNADTTSPLPATGR